MMRVHSFSSNQFDTYIMKTRNDQEILKTQKIVMNHKMHQIVR